jgi:ABC-2 type transport system permease protein
VLLMVMPAVLMVVLAPALGLSLEAAGRPDVPGSAQTVPGMVTIFSMFAVAIVGWNLFREHGWRTWPRLRAAGLGGQGLLLGKLAVPAGLLAVQHVLLFGFGVLALDLPVTGSPLALALVSLAFGAMVLTVGLAAAAVFATIQQLDAATNLGAIVLGGLGGAVVPVAMLPAALAWAAPLSPVYWAMQGYQAVLVEGAGVATVLPPVAVLAAWAAAGAVVAGRRLRLDSVKRTWG